MSKFLRPTRLICLLHILTLVGLLLFGAVNAFAYAMWGVDPWMYSPYAYTGLVLCWAMPTGFTAVTLFED